MTKSKIYAMGIATLLGFPALGITIVGLIEENPWTFDFGILHPYRLWEQILVGLAFGLISGLFSWWLINQPKLKSVKVKYGKLIYDFRLSNIEIFFLSLSAGVGEEFLFRGVLQTYWGVWFTSVFFVAIHGYLNPHNYKILIYGILMTILIIVIGYMKIYVGLISSIAAHFAIDVVLLYQITNDSSLATLFNRPSYTLKTHQKVNTLNEEKIQEPAEENEEATGSSKK